MSEPKWTYNSSQDCFYKDGYCTPNKSHIANALNDFELKIKQLTIEKKLQYDEFRSERNAMEDKISDLQSEVERLSTELESERNISADYKEDEEKFCYEIKKLESEVERLTADLKAAIITMEKWVDIEAGGF